MLFVMLMTTPAAAEQSVITLSDLSEKQIVTLRVAETTFAEVPTLVKVAFCESSLEHTEEDGSVKRGKVDSRDTGLMQINKKYHLTDSKKLGLDINNIHDNMHYALFLVKYQGLRPWKASKHCWDNLVLPVLRTAELS